MLDANLQKQETPMKKSPLSNKSPKIAAALDAPGTSERSERSRRPRGFWWGKTKKLNNEILITVKARPGIGKVAVSNMIYNELITYFKNIILLDEDGHVFTESRKSFPKFNEFFTNFNISCKIKVD